MWAPFRWYNREYNLGGVSEAIESDDDGDWFLPVRLPSLAAMVGQGSDGGDGRVNMRVAGLTRLLHPTPTKGIKNWSADTSRHRHNTEPSLDLERFALLVKADTL